MDTTAKQHMIKSSDWGNVLLGLWLVISPFVLNYSSLQTAKFNDILLGVAVGLLALAGATGMWKGPKQFKAAGFVTALLGAWLIVSAFVLGFAHELRPMWNNVVVGIVVGVLALSEALGSTSTGT